jgi:hypothetical protein
MLDDDACAALLGAKELTVLAAILEEAGALDAVGWDEVGVAVDEPPPPPQAVNSNVAPTQAALMANLAEYFIRTPHLL